MKTEALRQPLLGEAGMEQTQQPVTSDSALEQVGSRGLFQMLAAATLILSFTLNGHIIYGLSYLIYKGELDLTCIPTDQTEPSFACDPKTACNAQLVSSYSINFQTTRLNNWITSFDMVCTPDKSLTMLGSIFFICFTVGSLVWLILADKIGRKPLIRYGLIGHALIVIAILFVPYSEAVYVFMALQGIQVATTCQVAYVLLLEMVPTPSRSFYCAMLNTLDGGVSSMLLPLFYYLVGDWRVLFVFNLFVTILVFVLLIFLPESPRFFISLRKYEQARQAYTRIAQVNQRPSLTSPFQSELASDSDQPQAQKGLSQFCKPQNRAYLKPLIVVPLLWFTVDFVYYGINFGLQNMKGSIYFNGWLSGFAEFISYMSGGILASTRLGRKYTCILCYLVGGLACILYNFNHNIELSYVLLLLGKFGSGAIFFVVYLITTELFPTVVRGSVFGIANVCARIGGIVAPMVDALMPQYFMLAFGVMGILSCIGGFMLRETKGKPLKDVFQEEEVESAFYEKLRGKK